MAKKILQKKDVVLKLVEKPKTGIKFFYGREIKLLNDLIQKTSYPLEFFNFIVLDKKLDSLALLFCDYWQDQLRQKWAAYTWYPFEREEKIKFDFEAPREEKKEAKVSKKEFLN